MKRLEGAFVGKIPFCFPAASVAAVQALGRSKAPISPRRSCLDVRRKHKHMIGHNNPFVFFKLLFPLFK